MNTKKLRKLQVCTSGIEFAKTQDTPEEAWQNCTNGEWLLWIASVLGVDDRRLTAAKAMCAKQIEQYMYDKRSRRALQAALDYAEGKITRDTLNMTIAPAYVAYCESLSNAAFAAYAVACGSNEPNKKLMHTRNASVVSFVANCLAFHSKSRREYFPIKRESFQLSADICRKYLTSKVLTAYKNLQVC